MTPAERLVMERIAAAILNARPALTCPRCGAITHHPTDVRERYCPRCHQFHEIMALEDLVHAARAGGIDRTGAGPRRRPR